MRKRTHRLTLCGILFASALTLSALEGLIPSPAIPGIKAGLSNIVVMFAEFALGLPCAAAIAVLKALFVMLVRGASAGLISLCGGLASVVVMAAVKRSQSPIFTGIFGGISHNIGQLAAAALILGTRAVLWYAPVLVISGTAAGALTGFSLKTLMPYIGRFRRTHEKTRRTEAYRDKGKISDTPDGHIGAEKNKGTA